MSFTLADALLGIETVLDCLVSVVDCRFTLADALLGIETWTPLHAPQLHPMFHFG